MIKNKDNIILKNGDSIFKSQVIDSYIEGNMYYSHYVYLGYSGVSMSNPLKIYLQKPNGFNKYTLTTDNSNYQASFSQTNETSYKKFYLSNNLNSLYYLRFYNGGYGGYYYRGDLIKLLNQFPNLNKFEASISQFGNDLTNTSFPKKLKNINLSDTTLTGNVNTIENFDNLEEITLTNCLFNGNLTNISFNNLKNITFNTLYNLRGNLNNLIDNNLNFKHLYLNLCPLFSGNSITLNTEQLDYIYLNIRNNTNFTGSLTNWNFNTGLTYFYLNNWYLTGDVSNWNISNTKLTSFYLNDYSNTNNKIKGNLSNWVFPSTLTSFYIEYMSGLTALPNSFSGASSLSYLNINYCNGLTSITDITIPSSLRYYYVQNCSNLTGDINSINFHDLLVDINLSGNKLYGDIGNFVVPTATTYLYLNNNTNITGNISGLTLNTKLNRLQLNNTNIYGSIAGMSLPNTLRTLQLSYTKLFIDFDTGVFNTNGLYYIYLNNISGITGNLSNLVFTNNIYHLFLNNTNVNADLSKLNISKIYNLYASTCGSMYGNLTNWLTGGTSTLGTVQIHNNPYLSGDTSNWNVNFVSDLLIYGTSLTGALKHNNVYSLNANGLNITSNIRTDFNFSNRAYNVILNNTNITGSLSGVTLYSGIYLFYVNNCPNLLGSNHFINYIFDYRKYFTSSTVYFNIQNIGDTVTGSTETLGDLGTYTQFSGSSQYYYWNLTENEVNNLASGLDYNETGTNIPWNSKQKIYWMKNARISSTNLNKRYINYNIIY